MSETKNPVTVLVVGNCLPDNYSMENWLNKHFRVDYLCVDGREAALATLDEHKVDLCLINRVFDADGGSGLDLVAEISRRESACPTMLISNFADAQQKAVSLGALPGFGKSSLHLAETVEKVSNVLR